MTLYEGQWRLGNTGYLSYEQQRENLLADIARLEKRLLLNRETVKAMHVVLESNQTTVESSVLEEGVKNCTAEINTLELQVAELKLKVSSL